MPLDVLYEIGVEEIPAGAVLPALEQLAAGLAAGLAELRLSHGETRTYGTPRRLTVIVEAVQEQQEDAVREVKGPPATQALDAQGQPTPAAIGFARKQGVEPGDLQRRADEKGDFLYAVVREPGRRAAEVLPDLLKTLTLNLTFPKTMRWGEGEVRFARPIRWLVALAGEEVMDLEIAGVRAGRCSSGHRVLGDKQVEIPAPGAYLEALRANGVIADHRERRELIATGAHARAAECSGQALVEEKILTENNFLVEAPRVLVGSFDASYLALPREVIITVMQGHQRYFPVGDAQGAAGGGDQGNLLPHFLVVSNAPASADAAVLAGNERVLRPRLEDARFYLEEDMRRPLADRLSDLEQVTFMGGLGTLRDKTARLVALAHWLAERLPGLDVRDHETAQRAAELCKCDLVTMMIGDSKLGELQGIVGGHYARLSGETEAVAQAIAEHYLPVGAEDALPQSAAGALLSLADKTDNLTAAFRLGLEPTGSADPQALRRQATGLIRLVRDRGWALSWPELFSAALALLPEPSADSKAIAAEEVLHRLPAFLAQRLEALWETEGVPYDVARAVLTPPWTDLVEVSRRAAFLAELRRDEPAAFDQLVTIAERPARIRRPEGVDPDAPVSTALFEYPLEARLWNLSREVAAQVDRALAAQPPDYAAAVTALLTLTEPVHAFFEQVMVMVENEELRRNRLALMAGLDGLFLKLADFLKIVRPG
jgi:glycyl-tRNA synthetase beta chain